jgi:hypothetical protein
LLNRPETKKAFLTTFVRLSMLVGVMACIATGNTSRLNAATVIPDQPLFTGFTAVACVSDLQQSPLAKRLFRSTLIESFDARNRYDLLGRIDPIGESSADDVKVFASTYNKCLRTIRDERNPQEKLVEFAVDVDVLFARLIAKTLAVGEFNQAILRLHSRYLANQNTKPTSVVVPSVANVVKERPVQSATERSSIDIADKNLKEDLPLPGSSARLSTEAGETIDAAKGKLPSKDLSKAQYDQPTMSSVIGNDQVLQSKAREQAETDSGKRMGNLAQKKNQAPKVSNSQGLLKKQTCKTCKSKNLSAKNIEKKKPDKNNSRNTNQRSSVDESRHAVGM